MDFYRVTIPLEVQPSLVLSVEVEELGITAGLQDRVIQVYEGVVYMDFAKEKMREINGLRCGVYEPLDPLLLPKIYVAYNANESEPTEVFHNDIRGRFNRGETIVVEAMTRFAGFAHSAREALLTGDHALFARLMNDNFDTRRSIYTLPKGQVNMVEVARQAGASAKFAGSGGAIVGVYRDEEMLRQLTTELEAIGCCVIIPKIT
jgi:glucuronokinase